MKNNEKKKFNYEYPTFHGISEREIYVKVLEAAATILDYEEGYAFKEGDREVNYREFVKTRELCDRIEDDSTWEDGEKDDTDDLTVMRNWIRHQVYLETGIISQLEPETL